MTTTRSSRSRRTRRDRFDIDGLGGPDSCVLYLRLSQDRTGEGTAVERQEKECRALAARLGLTVARVYRDNDVSATNGKVRPDFERMLSDLATDPKPIVAWHQDRLLRLTSDLERVIDLDLPAHFAVSSSLDLSTPAGRAVGRTVAAWSQYEGEQKAERQWAANEQAAEKGKWRFSNRPYGYQRVNGVVEIVKAEADVVREGYARYLAGESYYAICDDWNARGIPTQGGLQWSMTQVRRLLRNEHYAGLASYLGRPVEVDGEIEWTPLIDAETWARYVTTREERGRVGTWSSRTKHLMSGMLVCGKCGGVMLARPSSGRQTYACRGCWLTIASDPVNEIVTGIVVARLKDPGVVALLRKTPDLAPIDAEIADLNRRRDNLVSLLGDGLLDKRTARARAETLTDRLDVLRKRRTALRSKSPLTDLALARSVATKWRTMPLPDQRRAISELGLVVTIAPIGRGQRGREAERVLVTWADADDAGAVA